MVNSHKKRVLMLTETWYPDTFGGSERLAWEQARGLEGQGFDVTVFVSRRPTEAATREELEGGGRLIRTGLAYDIPGSSMISILWSSRIPLRALLEAEPFDLVICQHPLIGSVYLEVAHSMNLERIPMIAIFHSSRPQEMRTEGPRRRYLGNRLWTALLARITARRERWVLEKADRILYFSDFSGSILKQVYGDLLSRAQKIPAGVDATRYIRVHEKRLARIAEQQHTTSNTPEPLKLLTVRRLTPRMGIDVLISAISMLQSQQIPVELRIAGTGHSREELEKRVQQLGLTSSIQFLGKISDEALDRELTSADLFVLPTTALEGFGIATLEALLSGLPVVGTPIGATPELLSPIHEKLITRDASARALADTIKWYAELSEEERLPLEKIAHDFTLAHYTNAHMNAALIRTIESLLPPRP